jgi:hypothetical protein
MALCNPLHLTERQLLYIKYCKGPANRTLIAAHDAIGFTLIRRACHSMHSLPWRIWKRQQMRRCVQRALATGRCLPCLPSFVQIWQYRLFLLHRKCMLHGFAKMSCDCNGEQHTDVDVYL